MDDNSVSVPYMNLGFALLSGPQLCLNQGTRVKIEMSQAAHAIVLFSAKFQHQYLGNGLLE